MNNVVKIKNNQDQNQMVEAYLDTIIVSHNSVTGTIIRRNVVESMISFLSGAIIGLRFSRQESVAVRFEQAAENLNKNWKSFQAVMRSLVDWIEDFLWGE